LNFSHWLSYQLFHASIMCGGHRIHHRLFSAYVPIGKSGI
jgi:hypothetical protein